MTPFPDEDDAPAWSDEAFSHAELRHGDSVLRPAQGTLTRRGRPPSKDVKRQVTLRLDADVIEDSQDATTKLIGCLRLKAVRAMRT